ncbi:MAG: DNA polymerase III subunit beta [Leptospiraceae bacterium]|nr:DNA polymerase III subunit beta [Leptospiraceae bacterium]
MKFLVKTSDFLKAIHAVEGVITVREIKSVLSNIKIETGDNIVFLSATDLEISIKTSVEAKIIEPGKSSIPAKQLNNTLKTINFSETSIETISDNEGGVRTLITDGEGKVDFKMFINGVEGEEITTIPEIDPKSIFDFPCFTLSHMIKKTSYSVALEDTRFVFNGLFIVSTNDKISVVGTDGRRLAKIERNIENNLPFGNGIIIPHKAIREIMKMIDTAESGKIGLINNQIYVSIKNIEILCKLIDGNYPDYEAVIPKENKFNISISKDQFQVALKQALIAAEEPSKQIRVTTGANNINLNSSNPGATEVSINIPIQYDGEEMTIGFKGDYLSDVVRSIDDENISINFNNPNAPVLFKDITDENYLSVIMPMKL